MSRPTGSRPAEVMGEHTSGAPGSRAAEASDEAWSDPASGSGGDPTPAQDQPVVRPVSDHTTDEVDLGLLVVGLPPSRGADPEAAPVIRRPVAPDDASTTAPGAVRAARLRGTSPAPAYDLAATAPVAPVGSVTGCAPVGSTPSPVADTDRTQRVAADVPIVAPPRGRGATTEQAPWVASPGFVPDEPGRRERRRARRADRRAARSAERGGRRSGWRRFGLVVLVAVLALAAYFGVTFWQVWATGRSDQAQPVDAIVVMGAAQYDGRPSPQLEGRLDQVLALWPEGYAPLVVVTGGNQPGDRFTEAEASERYLVEGGVPASAIVREDEGSSTLESLENVAALLDERYLDSVLIVTDPYHALRSRMIAEDQGLTAYVSPTEASVVTGSRSLTRHLEEAAGVSLGRLIGFDRLSGLAG